MFRSRAIQQRSLDVHAFNDKLQPRRRSPCLPTQTIPWHVLQGCACEIWMLLYYLTTSTLPVFKHSAGFRPPSDSSPLGSVEWIVMILSEAPNLLLHQGQPSGISHLAFFDPSSPAVGSDLGSPENQPQSGERQGSREAKARNTTSGLSSNNARNGFHRVA